MWYVKRTLNRMTNFAPRFCFGVVCLFLAAAVDATPLEFPEFDFRITLDSAFKVKSRFKRVSPDGGEVFNATARRLGQSFSCEYQPLPQGLKPDTSFKSRALLTAFAKSISDWHATGNGSIGEPRFESRSGIDFYRFRADSGQSSKAGNTVAFYHLFTRGDWIVICGSYHAPNQGLAQDQMADSIQPAGGKPADESKSPEPE